jgi:hypothetical protein
MRTFRVLAAACAAVLIGGALPSMAQTTERPSTPIDDRDLDTQAEAWKDYDRYEDDGHYVETNPYGWGDDVYDDKWDTGLWDMGEYDLPAADFDANPYGVGYDTWDDKWDTGLSDMGEYDYPYEDYEASYSSGDQKWYTDDWWNDYDNNQDGWLDW